MRAWVCMLLLCGGCATSMSTGSSGASNPSNPPGASSEPAANCRTGAPGCGEASRAVPTAAAEPVRTTSFVLTNPAGDEALKARLQQMGEAEVRRCWDANRSSSGKVKLRVATTMNESEMGVTLGVTTTDEAMKRCLKAGARVWVFRMGALDATGSFAYGNR